jgi:signal transduction histidine kinase
MANSGNTAKAGYATGSFLWRAATGEITASEQVYRILEIDPALPPTLERMAARVHPDDLASFHERIEEAGSAPGDFDFEHRLRIPGGSVKHVHVVAHGVRDQAGRLEYIGAIQDVTQRGLLEEAVGKARSDLVHVARVTNLGALIASIAHEVTQPLSSIITNASTCLRMLGADPANIAGARETARRTIRDGNRAAGVISRLRALFSNREATNEPVDLNEAAREAIALSLSELHRIGMNLHMELAEDLPTVNGDRVQLQQVILNLFRNAMDAMSGIDDRTRRLTIRTEREEGDRVRLSVQDEGLGFSPEDAERLFDAFYTTKAGGMGIGLCVSRSIIESHHGRLWAAANDGAGATFSFSIPRRPEDAPGAGGAGPIQTSAAMDPPDVMRIG